MSQIQTLEAMTPRRRKNRLDRRDRVLKAAMELIMADGLEGFSLHKLAQGLDYAVAALYRYFPSRAALLAELEAQVIELCRQRLEQASQQAQQAAQAQGLEGHAAALLPLVSMAHAYGGLAVESPAQFRLIGLLLADPRDLMPEEQFKALLPQATALFAGLTAAFDQAVKEKALAPGDALARTIVFWSGLHGLFQVQKVVTRRMGLFTLERLVNDLISALLLGWGASPEALKTAVATHREMSAASSENKNTTHPKEEDP